MKTIGALLFLVLCFPLNSMAVKLDCVTDENESYRLDFTPVDSTALLFKLPLKDRDQGVVLEIGTSEDEMTIYFVGTIGRKKVAFVFDVESLTAGQSSGQVDGSFLFIKRGTEFDTEVPMHCKK